eukprot:6754102-Alexandrium_andersonii.AAC.1
MSASLVGSEMCIRDRDTYSALVLEAPPQGYLLWKSKARGFLLGKFPQVVRVLDWAGKQLEPIGEGEQQR